MWYITVCFFITIISIVEYHRRKPGRKQLFNVVWFVLTCMLVFRYGQGTDYYEYLIKYESVDNEDSFFVNAFYHGEIGWYILNLIGAKLGVSFIVFNGLISLVDMLMIRRFILNYSPYKVFSLLLFYPTFYLTGCYSIIRQGLALCVFLGVGVSLLVEKKTLKYFIMVLLLTMIHTSCIALAILPFIFDIKKNKVYLIVGGIAMLFGLKYLDSYVNIDDVLAYVGGHVSYAGILVRVILFFVIWRLYTLPCPTDYANTDLEKWLFRVYLTGFVISLLFYNSATISQRLTMPFKAVEVALIPILLYRNQNYLVDFKNTIKFQTISLLFFLVVAIMNVEFVKNINSYIEQGNYYSWVSPVNYPYSSVFDQTKIRKYISNFDGE